VGPGQRFEQRGAAGWDGGLTNQGPVRRGVSTVRALPRNTLAVEVLRSGARLFGLCFGRLMRAAIETENAGSLARAQQLSGRGDTRRPGRQPGGTTRRIQ
jgi:hypothetical protein